MLYLDLSVRVVVHFAFPVIARRTPWYPVMLRGLSSLPTLSTRRFGAAAILLAVLLAVPREARATCGDYLWMPEHGGGQAHARAAAGDGQTSRSGERPLPCRGPECSRAPQAPLAPVPAPVTVDTHDQGLLAAMPLVGHDERAWAVRDANARPVIFGSSIFRPPRS